MTIKIRATMMREQIAGIAGIINQNIELSIFDTDNEDYERHIVTIPVDEIEISADFIEYLYKGIENNRNKEGDV